MTADVELLPLPEVLPFSAAGARKALQDWCRANVAHATAAKDAEIEALRAEVAEWKRVAAAQAELHDEAEARAERLAEALREIEGFTLSQFAGLHDMAAACIGRASRALLREQEEGCE